FFKSKHVIQIFYGFCVFHETVVNLFTRGALRNSTVLQLRCNYFVGSPTTRFRTRNIYPQACNRDEALKRAGGTVASTAPPTSPATDAGTTTPAQRESSSKQKGKTY
ncbi:MAG: hypothetical protein ACK5YU_03305, partial [Burkholderiales bacterium]